MLLQVILEGIGLGVLLILVCAIGIRKGAVGMVHLYSPEVQDIQRHFSNHCNDTQRLCVAGVHAGQKGWLQGMANGGRITLFLQGKALAIHAVLLSAP